MRDLDAMFREEMWECSPLNGVVVQLSPPTQPVGMGTLKKGAPTKTVQCLTLKILNRSRVLTELVSGFRLQLA